MIQQEINMHKNNLVTLINNLINTQLVNEEIFINNEIRKESEFLNSLLNQKQNCLMNQNNNFNNMMFQNNILINNSPNNVQMNNQQQIINQNDFNGFQNNKIINVTFIQNSFGKKFNFICKSNEIISDIIKKYREKANDYNENTFLCHLFPVKQDLKPFFSSTLEELKLPGDIPINVYRQKILMGSR